MSDSLPEASSGRVLDRRAFVRRSALSVAGVSSLSGLLAACGSSGSTTAGAGAAAGSPPSVPTGVLRVPNPAAIASGLDPSRGLSAADLRVIPSVYEGLAQFDAVAAKPVPALATSWTNSSDGKTWTFKLRKGVTFHDGESFDAAAVKATFDYYAKDLKSGGFLGILLPAFAHVDTSAPDQIVFHLKDPDGDFLRDLTVLRIISPKLANGGHDAIAKAPAGTGPFVVKSVSAQTTILEANRRYWGAGPYYQRLEVPFVGDLNARINGLTTGQLDIEVRVPPPQAKSLQGNTMVKELTRKSWGTAYMRFITTNPAVADLRIRQSIAYAIDRASIVKDILLGQAELLKGCMPPGVYGYSEPATQYAYDPDKARQLLKQASSTGHRLKMVAIPSVHVLGPEVAQAIADQLGEIGYKVTLDLLEDAVSGTDATSVHPKHDMFYGENFWINGGPLVYSLGFLQGASHYNPPEVQRLVTKMRTTPDGPERLATIAALNEAMAKGLPVVPLHCHILTDAVRSNLQDYHPTRDGLACTFTSSYRAA